MSDAKRFLGGKNENINVNGITGSNTYSTGEYVISSYAKIDGNSRYSHPIKFSILNPGSLIIDNDQQNADDDFTNDPSDEAVYSGNVGDIGPGYYLTSDIHSGRSEALAQWKPNFFGEAELYVYVPESGSTATDVVYKVNSFGLDDVFTQPIDHSANAGTWVKLITDTQDTFPMGENGLVELFLGAASTDYNYAVSNTEQVAFDALKVISVSDPLCNKQIDANETKTGTYSASCPSTHRSNRYAVYYTFVLTEDASVEIDLESSVDTYLFLLDGYGQNGTVLGSNDDGGNGYNSRLSLNLARGVYTIESTTYGSNKTGSFDVTLTIDDQPTTGGDCLSDIVLGASDSGVWDSDCTSTHRSGRYAKYHTFTLTQKTKIRIDLESQVDTYLYLLSGNDENGSVIGQNDDGGQGYNSRMIKTLNAGVYTIEATTYSSGREGSYVVKLNAL